MDVNFIPGNLREALTSGGVAGKILHAVRFSRRFSGESGEGYFFLTDREFAAIDRGFGSSEFRRMSCPAAEVSVRKRESEGNHVSVEIGLPDGTILTGCASFSEGDALEELLDSLEAGAGSMVESAAASAEPVSENAKLFAAGLLWAVRADGNLAPEQEEMLRKLCPPAALEAGVDYTQSNGFDAFLSAVKSTFSREQLTCLIANQLELAMCDGDLTGREMDFIRSEVNVWGYPVEEYRALRGFLLLKNQSPMLFA